MAGFSSAASRAGLDFVFSAKGEGKVSGAFERVKKKMDKTSKSAFKMRYRFGGLQRRISTLRNQLLLLSFTLGLATGAFYLISKASMEAESSMMALMAVSKNMGQSFGAASAIAQEMARTGLVSLADATEAVKIAMSTGALSMAELRDVMMGLMDAAAMNRRSTMSMGQAIVFTVRGVKDMSSQASDAAGITKNLSVMTKEYAASLGKTVSELTEVEKHRAMFLGMLKESKTFAGGAALAMGTLQGAVGKLGASVREFRIKLGDAFAEPMKDIIRSIDSFISDAGDKIEFLMKKRTIPMLVEIKSNFEFFGKSLLGTASDIANGVAWLLEPFTKFFNQFLLYMGKSIATITGLKFWYEKIWRPGVKEIIGGKLERYDRKAELDFMAQMLNLRRQTAIYISDEIARKRELKKIDEEIRDVNLEIMRMQLDIMESSVYKRLKEFSDKLFKYRESLSKDILVGLGVAAEKGKTGRLTAFLREASKYMNELAKETDKANLDVIDLTRSYKFFAAVIPQIENLRYIIEHWKDPIKEVKEVLYMTNTEFDKFIKNATKAMDSSSTLINRLNDFIESQRAMTPIESVAARFDKTIREVRREIEEINAEIGVLGKAREAGGIGKKRFTAAQLERLDEMINGIKNRYKELLSYVEKLEVEKSEKISIMTQEILMRDEMMWHKHNEAIGRRWSRLMARMAADLTNFNRSFKESLKESLISFSDWVSREFYKKAISNIMDTINPSQGVWMTQNLGAAIAGNWIPLALGTAFALSAGLLDRRSEEATSGIDRAAEIRSERGARFGRTIQAAELHIYISPYIHFEAEQQFIGNFTIEEMKASVGYAAVESVKQAIDTGEIDVTKVAGSY